MIERALIRVDGPVGHGKTTLIERLLAGYDDMAAVARGRQAERFHERRPRGDAELRRYRAAGASGVACFDWTDDDADALFDSDLMDDHVQAVIIEGWTPPALAFDTTVWVMRPPADGVLIRRVTYDRNQEERDKARDLLAMLARPDGMQRWLAASLGGPLAELLQARGELEKMRDKLRAACEAKLAITDRDLRERWALAPDGEGILGAQVVVAALHADEDRARAAAFLAEVQRLRKDREIFAALSRPQHARTLITALAADLRDPRDPGTVKVLRRLLRSMRR